MRGQRQQRVGQRRGERAERGGRLAGGGQCAQQLRVRRRREMLSLCVGQLTDERLVAEEVGGRPFGRPVAENPVDGGDRRRRLVRADACIEWKESRLGILHTLQILMSVIWVIGSLDAIS